MTLAFFLPSSTSDAPPRTANLLLWGSSRSGKTSILYRWKLGISIPTVDTVGLLEERFEYVQPKRPEDCSSKLEELGMASGATLTTSDGSEAAEEIRVQVHVCEIGRDPSSLEVSTKHTYYNEDDEDGLDLCGTRHTARSVFVSMMQLVCCCQADEFGILAQMTSPHQSYLSFLRLWSQSVQQADGVIYVVDCSSQRSIQSACEDVTLILHNEILNRKKAHLLILANKQDVYGSFSLASMEKMLQIRDSKRVKLVSCSAMTGEGLDEGLRWIIEHCPSK